jgi:secreted trypsin-like serine protease
MDTKAIHLFLILLCITITQQKIYQCNSTASCGCSLNPVSINARVQIVNGETAGADTLSWATSLKIGQYICGGAIISDSYIMTAAHCVKKAKSTYDITAYVGSTGLFRGKARSVSRIYSHPQYYEDPSIGYVLNDIALLKLSTSLNMADRTLAKICLPQSDLALPDNSDVIAIGWGTTREGGTAASQTLQQVTLNVIGSTTNWCKSVAYNMTTQFCAGIMPDGGKGESMYYLTINLGIQINLRKCVNTFAEHFKYPHIKYFLSSFQRYMPGGFWWSVNGIQ